MYMLKTSLLLICIWSCIVCFLAAQDPIPEPSNFRPYGQLLCKHYDAQAKHWKPGVYFVLVSADWCLPCKSLKAQLGFYPHLPIYVVDFDSQSKLAKQIMQSHRTVPCLVRYDIDSDPRKSTRLIFQYGGNLDLFLATSILPSNQK